MSKLQRLRDNLAAIEHALNGGNDRDVLAKYSGFGGMNFLLNTGDKSTWSKSDQVYYEDTVRLRQMLVKAAGNGNKYDAWWQSLKSSVLTAYYTPKEMVTAIFSSIYGFQHSFYEKRVRLKSMLDPAAGNGIFMRGGLFASIVDGNEMQVTAYEKDLLQGLILDRQFNDGKTVVHTKGFETIPNSELGLFDLVATNVPFGDIRVFDAAYSNSKEAVRREAVRYIHRYYVLKGLDCLRDGGIEAYIITSNYLNRDGEQLAEALKQARLIGAYRLANNLFKEAGTEVGTDLLVLQKDSHKQGITADESMLLTQYEDEGCPTNLYFQCYQDHVIATSTERDTDAYGKPGFVYMHRDGVSGISKQMGDVLAKDMAEKFDKGLFESNQNTRNTQSNQSSQQEPKMTEREEKMLAMHKVYTELYEYEATKQEENTELRKELNRLYDEFQLDFGCLNNCHNKPAAKKLKIEDILSLEYRDEKGVAHKADIFQKPVAFSTEELHEAKTAQDALAQSLNDYGKPDMGYMTAMTGLTEDEILRELDGEVFYNPLNGEFEIKAKFIAGDVIGKLEEIKGKFPKVAMYLDAEAPSTERKLPSLVVPEEIRILQSMRALQDAIPAPIPFADLDFNLGERWMNPQVYADFGSEFFSMPEGSEEESYAWRSSVTMKVKYDALLDQFAVSCSCRNEKIWSQYSVSSEATKSIDGVGLFIHALQNTCPKMMKYQRDSQGRCMYNDKGEHLKEEDPEKTQLANAKIEEIRQGFQDWLIRQPKEWKDETARIYNRKFNCFVKPKYDGSHQKFPGLSRENLAKNIKGFKDLYQSQKDCIWMLVQNGGGICDHEVGGGKTLIMCIAAAEMKRLGFCHKPMIIGLKANVKEIADTYRMAYPQAKVLYASEKDYSGSEARADFLNRAKNNNWDVVIMSHDSFGRIPQSDDIMEEVLADELKQIEDSLQALNGLHDYSISSQMRKGLERRKRNKEAEILKLQDAIKRRADDVVDFRMMGIDHIFVDESHQFKNLGFSTRHDRVAGLGNSDGSKRAFNLLMAIRTIQKRTGRDLGATFLSGTTVTNSLTELYSLFRYLRPQALAKQGITCFDAWAAIFTKKSAEFEFGLTNQIVLKERFRYFIKVPELAMFYNEITDFRTAEDVGIDRPKKHARLLNIKPTPDQEAFIETLMKFAKTGDFSLIGKYHVTDAQQRAKMLYATDMARKMSLDMRMIDESYGDHPRTKASKCAWLVNEYYRKFDAQKGTQMIFSDLSTYQGAGKGWNVYEEIKRKLVEEYGIPSKEIRFIQECKCDSKKQQLIKEVNEGKVRVLFGSTSMLGTGVNAQQRVVAVHHLDTPWRPSDLEQRDGRAIRKGNEVAKQFNDNQVEIIIYAVERSLDSYKFNLLHCKQTFINQLKRGQLSIRTLDEGAFDEKTGMNFSEYMAILSGNTDLLTRAKLEKQIAALEAERKSFLRDKNEQEQKQHRLQQDNETLQRNIQSATEDAVTFGMKKFERDGAIVNSITINGVSVPDGFAVGSDDWNAEIGRALLKIADTARTDGKHVEVGTVYGFPLLVKTTTYTNYIDGKPHETFDNQFYVSGSRLMYIVNKTGHLNRTSAAISATLPLQTLQRIADIAHGWQEIYDENESRIQQLSTIIKQSWTKEEQLAKLRKDLSALDLKINQELHKSEKGEYKKAA